MALVIPEMPDLELLAIEHLNADLNVVARVASEFPETPTYPLVVVRRVGGAPNADEPRWLDRASIEVSAWGNTKKEAGDSARAAEKSVLEMRGDQPSGGVVTAVRSAIGLQWLPDDQTGRPRYVFQVAATAHP